MATAVSVVVMIGVGFAAALSQVIFDMLEEKVEQGNEDKARIIMEEYEGYTEGA